MLNGFCPVFNHLGIYHNAYWLKSRTYWTRIETFKLTLNSNFNQHFNICLCLRFEFFFISTFSLFHSLFLSFSLSNIVHSLTFSHFRTIGFPAYLTLGMNFSDFFTFVQFFYCAVGVLSMYEFKRNFPILETISETVQILN